MKGKIPFPVCFTSCISKMKLIVLKKMILLWRLEQGGPYNYYNLGALSKCYSSLLIIIT
jgi:hypothetical protein